MIVTNIENPIKAYFDSAAQYPLMTGVRECIKELADKPMYNTQAAYVTDEYLATDENIRESLARYYSNLFHLNLTAGNVRLVRSASVANRLAAKTLAYMGNHLYTSYKAHPSVYNDMYVEKRDFSKYIQPTYMVPSISPTTGEFELGKVGEDHRLFIDDTQGFMKIQYDTPKIHPNMISGVVCNAAKIGGLPGAAALIMVGSLQNTLSDLLNEKEESPIIASSLALYSFKYAIDDWLRKMLLLRANLYSSIMKLNSMIIKLGLGKPTQSHIATIAIAKKRPSQINNTLFKLIDEGVFVSESTACTSNPPEELYAHMGVASSTHDIIRISCSHLTTDEEFSLLKSKLEALL